MKSLIRFHTLTNIFPKNVFAVDLLILQGIFNIFQTNIWIPILVYFDDFFSVLQKLKLCFDLLKKKLKLIKQIKSLHGVKRI